MLGVTVHWEASAPEADHARCAAQVESIRAYHLAKGYSDIAYNMLACIHGGQFTGRGWGRISGANETTFSNLNYWAVCMMTGPGEAHTPALHDATSALVAEGLKRSDRPEVWPHSHWFNTACCGDIGRGWINNGLGFISTQPQATEDSMKVAACGIPNLGVLTYLVDGGYIVRQFPSQPAGGYGISQAGIDYASSKALGPIIDLSKSELDEYDLRTKAARVLPGSGGSTDPKAVVDLMASRLAS